MQNRLIKATLEQASKADVAIIGLGDMNENSFIVAARLVYAAGNCHRASGTGVVGDLAGVQLFSIFRANPSIR
ncbi:sugar-binding domain-containing protein [Klebsiella pneumoniae]|uniref:sugar-binding domain-containing protein n=1 Tax=Klebsiella pneumoniae TaxID=573 RepID=UPI00226BBE81|nr:sugar-binding domain-containing protein [Klebsiella pneumoniae]